MVARGLSLFVGVAPIVIVFVSHVLCATALESSLRDLLLFSGSKHECIKSSVRVVLLDGADRK